MANSRKTQIRIIKRGTANNNLVSQAATRQREEQTKDPLEPLIRGISEWVTEFKARGRPNPRSVFQALFKKA